MLDFLRQRLTPEEQEQFDTYDGRAALASHFLVWPSIIALALYASGMVNTAIVFAAVAAVALAVLLRMAKRARALREIAEERYRAIIGMEEDDRNPG